MNASKERPTTINSLVVEFRSDPDSVRKWLAQDGIQPIGGNGRSAFYDRDKARECVGAHKGVNGESEQMDPETGLSWFKAKLREDTLQKRRENIEAEALQSERWMSTEKHFEILRTLCSALEQLPDKMKSELGLTAQQAARARQMLDEARQSAAGQVSEVKEAVKEAA